MILLVTRASSYAIKIIPMFLRETDILYRIYQSTFSTIFSAITFSFSTTELFRNGF